VNWDRIAGGWKQLRRRWGRPTLDELQAAVIREARKKQLAEWAAGRHDADPIHK
jgi:hypothetical protein